MAARKTNGATDATLVIKPAGVTNFQGAVSRGINGDTGDGHPNTPLASSILMSRARVNDITFLDVGDVCSVGIARQLAEIDLAT